MNNVPFQPMGQALAAAAFRKDLAGIVDGFTIFWNARRA
jgi:peptide/nickel transport system substrate-binding protein